jgi:transglutaminase-like putative cysteine protease
MKKLFFILLFLLISSVAVFAVDSRGPSNPLQETSRAGVDKPNITLMVALVVLLGLTVFVGELYKKDKVKFQTPIMFIVVAWMIMMVILIEQYQNPIPIKYSPNSLWEEEMISLSNGVDQEYLVNNDYLEMDSPIITGISDELAKDSDSAVDYTQKVLSYVNDNVKYVNEADQACFDGTATSILELGTGQCDTQSIVVTALLRAKSIPTRIVGGCIMKNPNCGVVMGFLEVHKAPIYSEVNISSGQTVFSRGEEFGRTGGLHAYPQAMLPENGVLEWFTLEATTGEYADTKCYLYYPEVPNAESKSDICVSHNKEYALACNQNTQTVLNKYGEPYTQ